MNLYNVHYKIARNNNTEKKNLKLLTKFDQPSIKFSFVSYKIPHT